MWSGQLRPDNLAAFQCDGRELKLFSGNCVPWNLYRFPLEGAFPRLVGAACSDCLCNGRITPRVSGSTPETP
jgi:hypothetical protein